MLDPTQRPAQSDSSAIELRDVSVSYDQGRTFVVDGVSFSVSPGCFIALVGASGSGKTSLLKTINRLVEPCNGSIAINGAPIAEGAPATLRRRIGYVFQGIGLFPHMNVGENVAITPRLLGWPQQRTQARIEALLDLVDLPRDYARRRPDELSGGQRQRVGLARALAAEPRIMLLDEPFGALDPVTRVALGDSYRDIHDRLGTTTIMVTHDMQEALLLADRILVMHRGKLVADEAPRTMMRSAPEGEAARLMDMPRRQAERLRRLADPDASSP